MTMFERAARLLRDGLAIPVDLTARLLDAGFDVERAATAVGPRGCDWLRRQISAPGRCGGRACGGDHA